jgi:thiol:disulfide interchange protein DsbD
MKQALLLIVFATSIFSASAQTGSAKQVKWEFSSKKLADKKYEVKMTATIAGTFHIYAVNAGVEGPVPTKITFTPNPLIALQGKITEQGKKMTTVEEVWGGKVNFFEKSVSFVQIVTTKTAVKTNLNGKIEFMVCNDEVCLPPSEVPFKIQIGN